MASLQKKTVIVTGGAQGIGKAVTKRFLTDGHVVVMAEYDQEAGAEALEEFRPLGEVYFFYADVAEENASRLVVESTIKQTGRIDCLVNNAGIAEDMGLSLDKLSLEIWNRVLSVNLTGMFLFAKHAASHLRKTKGSIVNIASTRALMSEKDTFAYSASKGGVVALSHSLAVSLGPDVRVNCISPGWIDTSEWKKKSAKRKPDLSETDHLQHPAGRVGTPEDISSLVAYLCSDEAGFITGANFVVDGGMTRKMIYEE